MHEPESRTLSKRRAVQIAAGLSLVYFVIQLLYIRRLPLVMDEFDGANEAYQLLHRVPYRDFQPYKTVLGYYLQIPPLLLTTDPWTGLMLSKVWLALLNTVAIFAATVWLGAIFTPGAALLGQTLLISMTTFLTRSSEIRVDMLTAWVGLASFLLLLDRRWLFAGAVAGLSFLVSQKGLYYILSANVAGAALWLLAERKRRVFSDLTLLNIGAITVIVIYMALWSIVSAPSTVISATFFSHRDIILADLYSVRGYWVLTIGRNPLFYFGALAGILTLGRKWFRGNVGSAQVMTGVYGGVLFALCVWHAQPWPYFFVILIPTLMVVHVALAEVLSRRRWWLPVGLPLALLAGVVAPLSYMRGLLARDNSYQRHVIRLADALLEDEQTYIAGNDLLYDRAQANTALRRLSEPRLRAMQEWSPSRLNTLIAELETARPKLIIDDYRLKGLPIELREYLASRFDHLWSSVSAYAPTVAPEEMYFDVWFDGEYRVETASGMAVIDGADAASGTVLTLQRGRYRNQSTAPIRLRLIPRELSSHADPVMKQPRSMFAGVYRY